MQVLLKQKEERQLKSYTNKHGRKKGTDMTRIIKPLGTLIFLSLLLSFISLPWGIVFSLITAFLSVFLISHYNNFVQLEEQVNQNWADIDTALQKRSDLTARIVEILKGYARHEHSTLEDVTRARKQFAEARTMKEKIESAEKFEGTMGRLLLLVEKYPELKANVSFNKALDTLTDLEDACLKKKNIVPYSVECARVGCTEGEIFKVFKKSFGLWKPPIMY